jgi:hypothetical protein
MARAGEPSKYPPDRVLRSCDVLRRRHDDVLSLQKLVLVAVVRVFFELFESQ